MIKKQNIWSNLLRRSGEEDGKSEAQVLKKFLSHLYQLKDCLFP